MTGLKIWSGGDYDPFRTSVMTYEEIAEVNGLAARWAVLLGFARSRKLDAKEQAELCRIKDRFKELEVQVPGEKA